MKKTKKNKTRRIKASDLKWIDLVLGRKTKVKAKRRKVKP